MLNVNADVLRPSDDFQSDLSVIDGFFCFVEDDDTIECLRDRFEDECGTRPRANWTKLRDVVTEFASLSDVPSNEQNNDMHGSTACGVFRNG